MQNNAAVSIIAFCGSTFHGSVVLTCFKYITEALIVSAHTPFLVIYHPVSEHTLLTTVELV